MSTLALGDKCGPVPRASVRGDCRNRENILTCCFGFYTPGFCPHDLPNVLCCTDSQPCSDNSGWCQDINHVSCGLPYVSGKCPGPPNVQCCRAVRDIRICTPGGPG